MIEPSDLVNASRTYASLCYHSCMRTSVIFDDRLAAEARELGINVSEAAREGLRQAVRRRRAEQDRAAYQALPEQPDADWEDAEAWGEP
jgi:post-segregation antitoxin (ccd killing protein)